MASGPDAEPEETVVVERDEAADTVVVDRDEAAGAAETVTADREVDAETVVVDRVDRTVVVERGPAAEGTVAVTRARATRPDAAPSIPGGRRRRGMTMPPVAPGFGRGAIEAVGPGAVASYEPRTIPAPPEAPRPSEGVEATRFAAPSMPSVLRRSRRGGLVALAVFAASCVVSVAGLIALGVAVFG